MRRLKITYATPRGSLPVLLLATLIPAGSSCGETSEDQPGSAGAAGADAGSTSGTGGSSPADGGETGGTGASGGTGGSEGGSGGSTGTGGGEGGSGGLLVDAGGGSGGVTDAGPGYEYTDGGGGGPARCTEPYITPETYVVDLPPEGTPADPSQICAASGPAAQSGWAARVTLDVDGINTRSASGQIEIAQALAGSVVGLPTVAVEDASYNSLSEVQISNLRSEGDGFAFDASWTSALYPDGRWSSITLKTSFEISCDGGTGATQTVEALTILYLCGETANPVWVSSGDECTVCAMICEMAPSPIIPAPSDDELPLRKALRLGIKPVARVGRSLVLLAEHDGGPDVASYDWMASGGTLTQVAPDVVVWTAPEEPGPYLVQVSVEAEDTAAVASLRYPQAA